ncbi:hypothetical protein IW140_002167 [Coemansia sp. RSA 1813]|nr:hypothetical protein EV178_001316 [Coemansia sp. RSA 1646]KAJ2570741.1 hypothetical protein IW140_002167 [Coemansia sp. RSA 1813]
MATVARSRLSLLLSPLRVDRTQCRCFGTTPPTASVLDKVQRMFSQVRQERLAANNSGSQRSSKKADKPREANSATPTEQEQPAKPRKQTQRPNPKNALVSSAAQTPRQKIYQEHRTADASVWMPKVYKDFEQPMDAELAKVVIFGTANAGKSTILNGLTGVDVSIVSSRPQTTRTRIVACATEGHKQLVFLDTPGVVSKQALRRVARSVVTTPWQTLVEADLLVLLLDAFKVTKKTAEVEKFMFAQLAKNCSVPAVLVVNKVDLIDKDCTKLADKVNEYMKEYPHIVDGPVYMSALDNVDELKALLLEKTKPANWMFPRNVATDMSDMMRVEECIRAEWFGRMRGHLPYIVKQRNVGWETMQVPVEQREYVVDESSADRRLVERTSSFMRKELAIDQELVVTSGSVAKILLGTQGEMIKDIRHAASVKISKALGIPVRLHLQVVVEKDTRSQK